jgi:hypothetical protein
MNPQHHWPIISFPEIQDTLATLHHWIQIIGKVRLKTMPWQNHSWHTTLYVTPTGFSTHGIPFEGRVFEIDLNFKDHKLVVYCSNYGSEEMGLQPMTVAKFYKSLFKMMEHMGIHVTIHAVPNEMEPAIPFAENTINRSYDPHAAQTIWKAFLAASEVFTRFRSSFIGKSSPVHLFWGAFDLAVTRFSGNTAPLHPGGMPNMPLEVMQEAYSQEVSSAGFWPGSKDHPTPFFYSYAYPTGDDFKDQPVLPEAAFYSEDFGEFILNYEDVVSSKAPDDRLFEFLQSTYEAAANTSDWNRASLEKGDYINGKKKSP